MRGFLVRKWMAYCRFVKARYDASVATLQRFWRGRMAQVRANVAPYTAPYLART